jgi:hypothetical protein
VIQDLVRLGVTSGTGLAENISGSRSPRHPDEAQECGLSESGGSSERGRAGGFMLAWENLIFYVLESTLDEFK